LGHIFLRKGKTPWDVGPSIISGLGPLYFLMGGLFSPSKGLNGWCGKLAAFHLGAPTCGTGVYYKGGDLFVPSEIWGESHIIGPWCWSVDKHKWGLEAL